MFDGWFWLSSDHSLQFVKIRSGMCIDWNTQLFFRSGVPEIGRMETFIHLWQMFVECEPILDTVILLFLHICGHLWRQSGVWMWCLNPVLLWRIMKEDFYIWQGIYRQSDCWGRPLDRKAGLEMENFSYKNHPSVIILKVFLWTMTWYSLIRGLLLS